MLKRNGTKLYYMHAEVDGRLNFVLQQQLRVLHSTRGANRNGAKCDIVLSRDCVHRSASRCASACRRGGGLAFDEEEAGFVGSGDDFESRGGGKWE